MAQTIDRGWQGPLPDADTNGIHDMLRDVKDYTRRIHRWVRLFGVIWLASLILGVVGAMIFALAAAVENGESSTGYRYSGYSGYSSSAYLECLGDPNTTWEKCQPLK
jgi:hypothetical protein